MTEELEKGTLGEDILLEVKELNVYYGLIRAIKERSPEAAAAVRLEGESVWT